MDSMPNAAAPYTHFNGLDPSRQQFVSWQTASSMNSTLLLGTSSGALATNQTNATMTIMHHVKLDNLQPNTRYYYQAKSASANGTYISPVESFETAPLASLPFKVALLSDSQQMWGTGHYGVIAGDIANLDGISFVADLGDVCEWPTAQPDWNLFMAQSAPWMAKYSFAPVMGNHDSLFDSATQGYDDLQDFMYYQHFGFSYSSGPWKNHFFYTFNWSNVQFVVGEIADGSQENIALMNQSAWFNETLAKGQDKAFRVLVFHRSLFSSIGDHPDYIARIKPIVNKYNVSLVMYGHDHHYERFLVDGHTYLCLGGGGAMQDTSFNVVPESQFLNLGPSYTTISFEVDHAVVSTYSEQNDLIESFTLATNGSVIAQTTGGAN